MDIFGCLPLFYDIIQNGNTHFITLANLSFTKLYILQQACKTYDVKQMNPWIYLVHPMKEGRAKSTFQTSDLKFPEQRLANYLHHDVYLIIPYDSLIVSDKKNPSIETMSTIFQYIFFIEKKICTIFYVDGGCDSIMKGE